MKNKFIILLLSATLIGCGAPQTRWYEQHVPTTDTERKQVAEYIEKVMANTPHTLSGHDQDWDDAITAAHRTAVLTFCRPTYWEYNVGGFSGNSENTGRWKYADAEPMK